MRFGVLLLLLLVVQPTIVSAQGKKISAFTEDTAPTTDDLVNTVNDPAGTPASRKATLANLTKGLNVSNLTTGIVPYARGGTGSSLTDPNADRILFWDDSAGAVAHLEAGTGLTISGTTMTVSSAAAVALSGITAATAANTIANGDHAQVWQWQITTGSKIAHRFTESAASTGASSVLFQADTIAASTAIPFMVKSRTNEVFRVAAASTQAQLVDGTVSAPVLSFINAATGGLYLATNPCIADDGVKVAEFSTAGPSLHVADTTRILLGTAAFHHDHSAANTTPVAVNGRKSRGTNSTPAAITTGDDLLNVGAHAYVGPTGTYVETARVAFDSVGTVSDASNGIGGTIAFETRKSGGNLTERAKIDQDGNLIQSNGTFATAGDSQSRTVVSRRSTTDATQSELFLDGSAVRLSIPSDSTWAFTMNVVARRTDADNESAAYEIKGAIDNNAGVTALVAAITKTVIAEDIVAWDATAEADDTNDAIVLKVTGEAAKTIRWVARVELVEVSG